MATFSLSYEDFVENLNMAKDSILESLVTDGLLTQEEAETWGSNCIVNLYKSKWYSRFYKKARNLSDQDADLWRIQVTRVAQRKNLDGTNNQQADISSLSRFTPNSES